MDVVLTILVIVAIAAMRSFMAPTEGECVRNVAVPLGVLLQGLEQRMPVLSLVVWAVVIFIAGINTGRYGVKYSLVSWLQVSWSAMTILSRRRRRCAGSCR